MIIYGLLTAIIQACAKIFLKKSFKDFPSSVAFFLESIFGLILWIPFAILTDLDPTEILNILPVVIISAILSEAYIFYIYTKGSIAITVTVFSTYSIFTVIFSRILNSELLSLQETLAILLTIIGIILAVVPKELNKKSIQNVTYILWPLSGAIAVGFSDTLSKQALEESTPGTFLFCLALVQIPVALAFLKLENQKFNHFKHILYDFAIYKYSIFGSFLIAISMILFWQTYSMGYASVAAPITATSPIFLAILARIFLKEEITTKIFVGIVFAISGLILLSV